MPADPLRPSTPHRKWRWWLVPALLLALACILLATPHGRLATDAGVLSFKEWSSRRSFDAALWRESLTKNDDDPIRLRMVNDLLRRHRLIGLSRDELVTLLGNPPPSGYFREFEIVYWLGPESGLFSIDSEWLIIHLGDDNRVAEAYVTKD